MRALARPARSGFHAPHRLYVATAASGSVRRGGAGGTRGRRPGDFPVSKAILGDEFTLWSHRLARHLALALDAGATLPETARLAELLPAIDEQLKAAVAGWTTPDRQRRALANQRLGLTQITLQATDFDAAPAAREARLCAVEDGMRTRRDRHGQRVHLSAGGELSR